MALFATKMLPKSSTAASGFEGCIVGEQPSFQIQSWRVRVSDVSETCSVSIVKELRAPALGARPPALNALFFLATLSKKQQLRESAFRSKQISMTSNSRGSDTVLTQPAGAQSNLLLRQARTVYRCGSRWRRLLPRKSQPCVTAVKARPELNSKGLGRGGRPLSSWKFPVAEAKPFPSAKKNRDRRLVEGHL
jgi:hypothetical protein